MKMDEDTKEMRYKKLESLLEKSTMFTAYIIQRMEQQKEEEKERRNRWLNKFGTQKEDRKSQQEDKEDEKVKGFWVIDLAVLLIVFMPYCMPCCQMLYIYRFTYQYWVLPENRWHSAFPCPRTLP